MDQNKHMAELLTPEGELLLTGGACVPWSEYPRPHMQRESYLCLNGAWDYAETKKGETPVYNEKILVPFVPQSRLSGLCRHVDQSKTLCYRRTFALAEKFMGGRVLLHVDAADQVAAVTLNGVEMGVHYGGYDRFSFDVTEAVRDGENLLEIRVRDALDEKILPYGKQRERRGGMWYTPISGIWQTVWIECVPNEYIREVKTLSNATGVDLSVEMSMGAGNGEVILHLDGGDQAFAIEGGHARIEIPDPVYWSPEHPHLYRMTVRVGEDRVRSYFAMRTVDVREVGGIRRLCLNGKPYFFHGLLDQGYFPDGIFLPASPNGFERDILAAKKFGFNMLRKHIKVEPELFYYACDRLGIIVFQDMVNNGDYSFLRDTALPTVGLKRLSDRRLHRDSETRAAFLSGMEKTVRQLSHHPCVCYWTIFNEGWGQFDHAAAYKRLRALDPTRIIDAVSGWFEPRHEADLHSDVKSLHIYFKPVRIPASEKPLVLSEFGGYSYRVEGHIFNLKKNYGYRTFTDQASFEDALEKLYENEVLPAIGGGLCAAVYTQLSDVEDETNGLLTYDRRVEKADARRMREIATRLYGAIDQRA